SAGHGCGVALDSRAMRLGWRLLAEVVWHGLGGRRDKEAGPALDVLVLLAVALLGLAAAGPEEELERIAVAALSAEGNDVAPARTALDDGGRGGRDDRPHGLVGDIGGRRQKDGGRTGPRRRPRVP